MLHIMEIEAVEGQIAFAGILANQMIADYFNDDGVYENILTKMTLDIIYFILKS